MPSPPGAAPALPLLNLTLALLAVLAVIAAMAFIVRRLQRGGFAGNRLLRSHATLALGARERAVLVEAGGRFLLIGVAAGNVRTLCEFEQPPTLPAEPAPQGGGEFVARLREALRNRT